MDHVGFPVSDYARSKAFTKRLRRSAMRSLWKSSRRAAKPGGRFRCDGKPDFWIGGEGGLNRRLHVAITAKNSVAVDAFYRAALAAGGKDNGAPGLSPQYHPNYDGAFVFDPDGHNVEAVGQHAGLNWRTLSRPGVATLCDL